MEESNDLKCSLRLRSTSKIDGGSLSSFNDLSMSRPRPSKDPIAFYYAIQEKSTTKGTGSLNVRKSIFN